MKKALRLTLSILSSLIVIAITVPILLSLILQIGFVQNYMARRLTGWLSEKTGTTVTVRRVDVGFFNRAVVEGFYVEDRQGDTLLYADRAAVGINAINFLTGDMLLGRVSLRGGTIRLTEDSTGRLNASYVLENLIPEEPMDWTKVKIRAGDVDLEDIHFSYRAYRPEARENGVNFQDLDVRDLRVQLRNFSLRDGNLRGRLDRIAFSEKSGFALQELSARRFVWTEQGLKINRFKLISGKTSVDLEHVYLTPDPETGFADFNRKVGVDVKILPSQLAYETIAAFSRKPSEVPTVFGFRGEVKGKVADLTGTLHGVHNGGTEADVSFQVTGLPDIQNSWFRMKLENLSTRAEDVRALYGELSRGKSLEGFLDVVLQRTGNVSFSGSFDGLIKDFTASGELTTDQGTVHGELKFMPGRAVDATRFLGNVSAERYRIGDLLDVGPLGEITFRAKVDAVSRPDSLRLVTDATISHLRYQGYDYRDIGMDGEFSGNTFVGNIAVADSNLRLTTVGRFDLTREMPAYDFQMDLQYADLYALGWNKRDTVSQLSARFSAHATGTQVDNVNGTARIERLTYVNYLDTVRTGVIRLEARNSENSKAISMFSDFADIELRGRNSYKDIVRYFSQSIQRYMPVLPEMDEVLASDRRDDPRREFKDEQADNGYYLIRANVKQANNVAGIFIPGLEIAQGSSLAFLFNPYLDQFSLSVKSDYILIKDNYVAELIIESRNQADSISIYASAEELGVGRFYFPNFSIVGGLKENRISLATHFQNAETGANALISTTSQITRGADGKLRTVIGFNPTTFSFENQLWYIAPGTITIDPSGITFDRVRLWGEGQELRVEGKASDRVTDTLRVNMRNFDMSPLTQVVSRQGYRVSGNIGGEAQLVAPRGDMQFTAALSIDSLALNDNPLGNVDFISEWDGSRKWINFFFRTPEGQEPIRGVFDSDQKRYRVDVDMPRFNLALLEPLYQDILIDTRGRANTKMILTGTGNQMYLNGTVDIDSFDVTVAFTNTRYSVSGPVTVTNNRFELGPVPITDGTGGGGTITAFFDSEYFRKLQFGVSVDFNNMLCMNTTLEDNDMYYGKVYGNGNITVQGDDRATRIEVRAETARNSTFVMPLSDIETVSEADFIRFRDWDAESRADSVPSYYRLRKERRRRVREKSELQVDLNLTVLPNTEAQIIMDPRLGEAIRGRGNGRFRMQIVPDRDIFTMDGQLEISEGTYLLTLYNLANKYFIIQPGGTLTWTGDPRDPIVDIYGIYRVRTSIRPLLGTSTTGSGSGNVTIHSGIHLTERLFDPTIELSITAPGADPETTNLLNNLLNTQEAITMQFAYLMLTNSFMPDNQMNAIGTMSGSLAGVTGMEFLSNQISNLISGSNYNIRFGYRPQSDLTSEEFTFDIGADIISNKLSFEVGGNYDISQSGIYSNQHNPLSVDGYLTWILNKSGSLKLKGFTRTIDRFDESQGLQDNGVGVYYRQEFQDWKDLKARYRRWAENRRENKRKRQDKRALKRMGITDAVIIREE